MMVKFIVIIAVLAFVAYIDAAVLHPTTTTASQQAESSNGQPEGTRWAVLMAGSNEMENYRHQADICHAYQLLKQGGLDDENIIVMMYDDIAYHMGNPTPGKIINRPGGPDLYEGVLKDYTADTVNADNFYAVLLGNTSATRGGNGKVLASGPNDHVFVYFADHGGPGILCTPNFGENIYADKLNAVLRQMHKEKRFASLVFYVEACESGSIFEGLMKDDLNIYVMTAANSTESSWATYCDSSTCLGDLFSVSWMEDVDSNNRSVETLEQEYERVKKRTLPQDSIHAGSIEAAVFNSTRSRNDNQTEYTTEGTKWAVLMAGSNHYYNYRHQADVCHAYQLLKQGGLKDENIITMMYDDIAHNPSNPTPGKIINRPDGPDVYKGVVKDYTGDAVTAENFFAILLGNSSATRGGSGKVLNSGPNDHVLVYYSDHGGPGVLGTPTSDNIEADKLNEVLRQMHKEKRFASLVFYVEACESGSIFEGLLKDDLNIYAMTASNSTEPSYAAYCNFFSCLGDLFSVSWLEDAESSNRSVETIAQEYQNIKLKVAPNDTIQLNL